MSARGQANLKRRAMVLDGAMSGVLRRIHGGVDAAQTTNDNQRHWAEADRLSADAAFSHQVRFYLRNRGRYEFTNNPHCSGIVTTWANDVVGIGPRLQLRGYGVDAEAAGNSDSSDYQTVERLFAQWAEAAGLAEKLVLGHITRAVSGEVLWVQQYNPELIGPVKLDYLLVEPDQCASPWGVTQWDPANIDGVHINPESGAVLSYDIMRWHPGNVGMLGSNPLEFKNVDASLVIHDFVRERPGQHRGIPEITPALPVFAQLRRYDGAVLQAAETAANFAAVLQTDAPVDGDTDASSAPNPLDVVEMVRGAAVTLPDGYKLGQIDAKQPTTGYVDFRHERLNECGRWADMPLNVILFNSSGYNYSSGQLDHLGYDRRLKVEQKNDERTILARVFASWLEEARLIEGYLPERFRRKEVAGNGQLATGNSPGEYGLQLRVSWYWRQRKHADPSKVENARGMKLAAGMTTLAAEFAEEGKDWEEELAQQAIERRRKIALGLPVDDGGGSIVQTGVDENGEAIYGMIRPAGGAGGSLSQDGAQGGNTGRMPVPPGEGNADAGGAAGGNTGRMPVPPGEGATGNGTQATGNSAPAVAPLNGAQITSAVDLMGRLKAGALSAVAAEELLVAVGIGRQAAQAMVKSTPVDVAANESADTIAFKRQVVSAFLADRTVADVLYNATDVPFLLTSVGLKLDKAVEQDPENALPWMPVKDESGGLVSGEVLKDKEGKIVGGKVETPAGTGGKSENTGKMPVPPGEDAADATGKQQLATGNQVGECAQTDESGTDSKDSALVAEDSALKGGDDAAE